MTPKPSQKRKHPRASDGQVCSIITCHRVDNKAVVATSHPVLRCAKIAFCVPFCTRTFTSKSLVAVYGISKDSFFLPPRNGTKGRDIALILIQGAKSPVLGYKPVAWDALEAIHSVCPHTIHPKAMSPKDPGATSPENDSKSKQDLICSNFSNHTNTTVLNYDRVHLGRARAGPNCGNSW